MSAQTPHKLMLQNTLAELMDELMETPRESSFDKGYRQGMARALDVFKQQAEVFGIPEDVGLGEFKYEDWLV